MLKRIAKSSVWAKGGVAPEDWRIRNILRVVLPLTDLFFMWFGIVGAINGVSSVQEEAGQQWQFWWSVLIALSALICLIGVGFPRLWAAEQAAKVLLIGMVSAYIFLYVARGLDDPKVLATGGLIVILILLPIWRVNDLVGEKWKQQERKKRGRKWTSD